MAYLVDILTLARQHRTRLSSLTSEGLRYICNFQRKYHTHVECTSSKVIKTLYYTDGGDKEAETSRDMNTLVLVG